MPGRKWPAGLYLQQGGGIRNARSRYFGLTTTRNKKTMTERLEKVKFCPHCRKRTTHKETK